MTNNSSGRSAATIIEGWVEDNANVIRRAALSIWEYAEVGIKEERSAQLLADMCREFGFSVEMGIAGMPTAFVARWGDKRPAVGFMAEYDALPGLSQKTGTADCEPLVKGAPGHGCGHNLLGAGALGAAIALKTALEATGTPGSVYFFGCPAEETISAKGFIVRDGYFDDVDAVLDWHPGDMNAVQLRSTLAADSVKYRFHGRSAHAAGNPEWGRSALDAVELMNVGTNYLREHVPTSTRMHYVITNGGGEPNVVPAVAEVWYYIRAPLRYQVMDLRRRVDLCAKGAAMMTETEVDIQPQPGGYVDGVAVSKAISEVMNEEFMAVGAPGFPEETRELQAALQKTVSPEQIREQLRRFNMPVDYSDPMHVDVSKPEGDGLIWPGSTDVGDVSWKVPTGQMTAACKPLGVPGHSWQATSAYGCEIGVAGTLTASKVLGRTAWRLITESEVLEEAKKEHEQRIKDTGYEPAMTADMKPPLDQWDHGTDH